ncbi:hypothetical protein MKW92_032027 [Papaver armeniacum]|nr:hypothetical protein MKW92_032027 [Papaver armeniacum]
MASSSSSSSYLKINHSNPIPLSLTSSLTPRHRPSTSISKALAFSRLPYPKLSSKLIFNVSRKTLIRTHPIRRFCIPHDNNPSIEVSNSEIEGDEGHRENLQQQQKEEEEVEKEKVSQFKKRVVFGVAIGVGVAGVVLAGGWIFTVALAAVVYIGAGEYFELVRSQGITSGMTPLPQYLTRICSVICALMPVLTLYYGRMDVSLTSFAFVVAVALLLQRGNPRFAQLSNAMFGLFYCGYLPCFWVKLRCGLAAPALNSGVGAVWPILLGGRAHWTVGLVATLISFSSIIAADTYAFLGGKTFGRTPLTTVSPKKTWEGAIAGLSGCIATALMLSKVFCWPTSLVNAAAFGLLNFAGSLFGDLIESMIKREAGVKDSGSLIPGHGGILDRVDSYIFTGALAYSFVRTFLPLYGV